MFEGLKNSFDFFIRQHTQFSRKNYYEPNELSEAENNYVYDVLEKYFPIEHKEKLSVLDIGSKNWSYVRGEYKFFNKHCEALALTGIELDAHRLYTNFYSRYEVAKFHIKNLQGVNYIADDFLNVKEKFDYIVWFLPFVKKRPHLKWGLPLKHFKPEALLAHAYNSLNAGGKIFVVNQGEEEYQTQQKLLRNLPFTPLGEIKSEFLEYKFKRFGIMVFAPKI